MKSLFFSAAFSLLAASAFAQKGDVVVKVEERTGDTLRTTTVTVPGDTSKRKKGYTISVGGEDGVLVTRNAKAGKKDSANKSPFKIQWGMLDLGFNRIHDESVYGSYTPVGSQPSADLFKLRESKSINVNVWILNTRLRLAETKRQRLYLTSGLGLQMYNFRFESGSMYKSDPVRFEPIPSNLTVEKNKLGFTYASIPLGLLAKTRIGNQWLVYGAGVTGGYRIASWTKLKTEQQGKEKNHDPFNFADFNACVTAEIGVDNILRLYGTYQLTSLQKNDGFHLDQHPFAIGVRFLGL